jgi:hypothetical protein
MWYFESESIISKITCSRLCLGLQFQKVKLKNTDFKMCELKTQFLKTQLGVRHNRDLTFKIVVFSFKMLPLYVIGKHFFLFINVLKSQFFKNAFPNDIQSTCN